MVATGGLVATIVAARVATKTPMLGAIRSE
jgi:hypothetical protein